MLCLLLCRFVGGVRSFSCNSEKTFIDYGSIDQNGKGYVYKLKSDAFREIESGQWISETEVVPEEVYEINFKDYWHTISFSPESQRIQKLLYG